MVSLIKCTPRSLTKVGGQSNCIKINSYKNLAVTIVVFIHNTLASTHLVAYTKHNDYMYLTCYFNGAYEIHTPFCERLGREHRDQFSQTGVDQIACPLAIVIGIAMVHNILAKCWPLAFSNQFFSNCDVYQKMASTYPFMHFLEDYQNFLLV